jgi:electron transport complex protein RnfE
MSIYKQTLIEGLWRNNPGLVQFLGICPLLAVSNTLVNGLGLGLATIVVLICSNLLVSLTRNWIAEDLRLPAFVLLIAALVTVVELAVKAWLFELWLSLGIFLPLIVTNCVILARAESFASRQPPLPAVIDGLAQGVGFASVLVVLGALREIVGQGTLFANAEQLFGPVGSELKVTLWNDGGFLLALLPPGAFLGLALLIALRNRLLQRRVPASAAATGEAAQQQLAA